MELSSKQRRELKGQGMTMADDVRLGKSGLSEGFLQNMEQLFARKELVKLKFTELEGDARKDLAVQVAQATRSTLVSVAGKSMLLYRANPDMPARQRALKSAD